MNATRGMLLLVMAVALSIHLHAGVGTWRSYTSMKDVKDQTRFAIRSPLRSVSLQIRDYQVTLKVKSPVPQKPAPVRWSVR